MGGTVQGLAAGRSVTLQNNEGDSLVLTRNATFTFGTRVADSGAYAVRVTAQPQGQACRAERGTGTAFADVADIAVVCSDVAAVSYRIGGTVSGLQNDGSILELRNNRLDFLSVSVNGDFRFNVPVGSGEPYAVVVQALPAGRQCMVNNGTGMAMADVTDVEVICTAASAVPPGGVQSMAGTWLNGACVQTAPTQSTRRLLRVTAQTGSSAAVSESTATYTSANCSGSFTPGAFQPASLVSVRRTERTETIATSWTHWQAPSGGATYSSLWHWRSTGLCLRDGDIGSASDPEIALPSAAAAQDAFANVPAVSAACYFRG